MWIAEYPAAADADLILTGFKEGFHIPYKGPRTLRLAKNHKSALLAPELIGLKLQEEVDLGRVGGPFDPPPLDNLIVSPIGLVCNITMGSGTA